MPTLTLRGLGKSYGPAHVVRDVDLCLVDGEFVSLLGPSGCGKTTTLRMVAGFIEPTSGTIEMDGRTLSAPGCTTPPERRGMSMIFQSYAIWPHMTVAENVAFGLGLRKVGRADTAARVAKILDVVRMNHLAARYPAELSGGQQQRVALARAIVVEPKVLLLDEPLSNLDANLREEMRFEIRRLHDEFRITTIYVTHDQAEAMVTSDRIVVMNAGRIDQVDDPVTLYTRPKTRFVAGFIGRTNLLDGVADGQSLVFDGFTLPNPGHPAGRLCLSIRPEDIALSATAPVGPWQLPATVTARAFLGERWDYVLQVDGSPATLRAAAAPTDAHPVGARLHLVLDPARAALIPETP